MLNREDKVSRLKIAQNVVFEDKRSLTIFPLMYVLYLDKFVDERRFNEWPDLKNMEEKSDHSPFYSFQEAIEFHPQL